MNHFTTEYLHCLFGHVLSQLTSRWIPPPIACQPIEIDQKHLQEISQEGWCEMLDKVWQSSPWAGIFKKQLNEDVGELGGTTHRHIRLVADHGGHYIVWSDYSYPFLLRQIPDAPLALSAIGDWSLVEKPMIAIVGSRKASAFALFQGEKLGMWLSDRGYLVVSGGAWGCDSAAHQGALNSEICPIPTAVVLASGLQHPQPVLNHSFFSELLGRDGLFISERLWWQNCRPWDFPIRNRIISGLCEQTIVLQASLRSGTMSTAKTVLDQGREVVVLVHPDQDIHNEGGNRLMEEGARTINSAEDFLADINGL